MDNHNDMYDEMLDDITDGISMILLADRHMTVTKIQAAFRGFLVRRRMNMIEELFEYDDEEQRYQNYRLDCQMDCRD